MSTRRAALVVLSQLQIVALAVHPDGDVSDPGPGVEPDPECPRARSHDGLGTPAKPSAAKRSRLRASRPDDVTTRQRSSLMDRAKWTRKRSNAGPSVTRLDVGRLEVISGGG